LGVRVDNAVDIQLKLLTVSVEMVVEFKVVVEVIVHIWVMGIQEM
jgi:hypothetical protein